MDSAARLVVFVGPSAEGNAIHHPRVEQHPPVVSGDLRRLAQACPPNERRTFLVLDGEFGQSLALTVGEIRWALAAGHRVFGGTSMGALRACEAGPAGMVGVGTVYRQLLAGLSVADADLGIGSSSVGVALTVPMIDIRHLAFRLLCDGLRPGEVEEFVRGCEDTHFAVRRIADVIAAADAASADVGTAVRAACDSGRRREWNLKWHDVWLSLREALALQLSPRGPSCAEHVLVPVNPNQLLRRPT